MPSRRAEKALKAALVLSTVEPPRTHDLEDLRRRLPEDWRVRRSPRDLARLSVHGVESRVAEVVVHERDRDGVEVGAVPQAEQLVLQAG